MSFNYEELNKIYSVGNEEFDIKLEKSQVMGNHYFIFAQKDIETSKIMDFLEYQYQKTEYKKSLLYLIQKYLKMYRNQLIPEKVELNYNWIDQKIPFEIKHKEKLEDSFAVRRFMVPYDNVDKWGAKLLKLLHYKPNELVSNILIYGIELSQELLELHDLGCNSQVGCSYTTTFDEKVQFSQILLDKIQLEKSENSPQPNFKNKIQWLGTQKQLAELFIELEKKGWIERIEAKTIKACFTNSHSIQQPLKPITDSKTYQKTYDQVYTSQYIPSFFAIRANTKASN